MRHHGTNKALDLAILTVAAPGLVLAIGAGVALSVAIAVLDRARRNPLDAEIDRAVDETAFGEQWRRAVA